MEQGKIGAVSKQIEINRKKLEELNDLRSNANQDEVSRLMHRMDELLYREEMWLQRSQIVWLKEGDRNTNFFHHKVAGRAKKN
jgi:hypothetical protein